MSFIIISTFLLLSTVNAVDINCLMHPGNETCIVENLIINEPEVRINKVHQIGLVSEVFIDRKTVNYLPENIGSTFPNLLTRLKVQRSELKEISRKDLKELKNLKVLNFWYNELSKIPADTFHDLVLLEEIDLSDNEIESLDIKVLKESRNLKVINLNSNNFVEIDVDLFKRNEKLEKIFLEKNSLKILPTFLFRNLKSLTSLKLDQNNIEFLQNRLFDKNENLRELTVSNNFITSVGAQNLEQIQKLESYNFLYNDCTKSLNEGDSLSELEKILREKCDASEKQQIQWLEEEVKQIERFKRNVQNELDCTKEEITKSNGEVLTAVTKIDEKFDKAQSDLPKTSSTSEEISKSVKESLKESLDAIPDKVKTFLETNNDGIKKDVKQAIKEDVNIESEVEKITNYLKGEEFKTSVRNSVKMDLEVIRRKARFLDNNDFKTAVQKSLESDFTALKEKILTEEKIENAAKSALDNSNLKSDIAAIENKIPSQEDFKNAALSALNELKIKDDLATKDDLKSELETVESNIKSLINELRCHVRCDFVTILLDFMKEITPLLDADKSKVFFDNLIELKKLISENKATFGTDFNEYLKDGATDDAKSKVQDFIDKLKYDCKIEKET